VIRLLAKARRQAQDGRIEVNAVNRRQLFVPTIQLHKKKLEHCGGLPEFGQ
jgi:hypothetical protein